MRELRLDEIDMVGGGLTSKEAAKISAVFGTGAALTGSFALVPGAHVPVAGAIAGVMALGASGFAAYAAFVSPQ